MLEVELASEPELELELELELGLGLGLGLEFAIRNAAVSLTASMCLHCLLRV